MFLGTPAFAVPTLERIVEAGHEVMAVFTQPDRPKGRGQTVTQSPVKEAALRLGLPVHQPERIRRPEVVEQLRAMAPEAMVVVGYGQIIPQVDHRYSAARHHQRARFAAAEVSRRGADPVGHRQRRNDTGVTTMRIDAGLDTGDMLLKWETAIGPEENALELGRAAGASGRGAAGARHWRESGTIEPEPQDDAQATLAPILKKEDGQDRLELAAREDSESDRAGFCPGRALTLLSRADVFTSGSARRRIDS